VKYGTLQRREGPNNTLRLTSCYKYHAFQAGFLGSWGKAATSGMAFAYY